MVRVYFANALHIIIIIVQRVKVKCIKKFPMPGIEPGPPG